MTTLTKAERTAQFLRAVENAKATLVPGDVLMVKRCGGLKVRYVFKSWDGNWATSIMRNDIAATGFTRSTVGWLTSLHIRCYQILQRLKSSFTNMVLVVVRRGYIQCIRVVYPTLSRSGRRSIN